MFSTAMAFAVATAAMTADLGVLQAVAEGTETAIAIKDMEDQDGINVLNGKDIDVKKLVNEDGFTYGDMTSVSISPDGKTLAAAIQAEGYADKGKGCTSIYRFRAGVYCSDKFKGICDTSG